MRIGELASRTGLTRDTIRFYEREGLIASEASSEASNDYRDYPEDLVERLAMIGEARSAGFSIEDLRQLLRHLEGEQSATFDAERFIDGKIAELRTIIARSRKLLSLLTQTKAAIVRPPPGAGRSLARGKGRAGSGHPRLRT